MTPESELDRLFAADHAKRLSEIPKPDAPEPKEDRMSLYAETNGFAEYDGSAHKLLSDNRALYLQQSAMTRDGRVPTAEEVREAQGQDAAP